MMAQILGFQAFVPLGMTGLYPCLSPCHNLSPVLAAGRS